MIITKKKLEELIKKAQNEAVYNVRKEQIAEKRHRELEEAIDDLYDSVSELETEVQAIKATLSKLENKKPTKTVINE